MPNEALYQKYRSQTFDELVGQEYVVRSMKNAVREGKVGHAYLFCGPRGTGKTSMARLLARAVNCENRENAPCGVCENCIAAANGNHPDIIEINAANETHVEDIRDLIERARLAPMMGKQKIYIVDEVHQLSSSAASALLKTLEEPPEHIIFILATTDPQKLLNTIISRCQRFDFSKVSTEQIKQHMIHVAEQEGIGIEPAAAEKMAMLADGGMRDALSMLEQATSYACGDIHESDVDYIYGLASTGEKLELINAIFAGDLALLLERIEGYGASGLDLKRLTTDLINALKDAIIYQYTKNTSLLRTLNAEQAEMIANQGTSREILRMIEVLMKASEEYKMAQSVISIFEVACMKMLVSGTMEEEPENVSIITPRPKKIVHEENVSAQIPYVEAENVKTETHQSIPVQNEQMINVGNVLPEFNEIQKSAKQKPITITPVERKVREMTIDTVVSLLVQCDKDSKSEDMPKLNSLTNGFMVDRYIATLKQAELKASGKDCLLLSASSSAVVNMLNEQEMNKNLYLYLKENAEIDKVVFAVTDTMYNEAVQKFIELRHSGSLPQPLAVERYQEIQNEEEKGEAPGPEDLLRELLGDNEILKVHD